MVGSAPYTKPCNLCGKQIILGIDAETNKWRPWDDYNAKIKHNCSAKAVTQENVSTLSTQGTGLGAAKSEEVAIVHARVTDANTKLDMLMFLAEKIANKLGVELDESKSN